MEEVTCGNMETSAVTAVCEPHESQPCAPHENENEPMAQAEATLFAEAVSFEMRQPKARKRAKVKESIRLAAAVDPSIEGAKRSRKATTRYMLEDTTEPVEPSPETGSSVIALSRAVDGVRCESEGRRLTGRRRFPKRRSTLRTPAGLHSPDEDAPPEAAQKNGDGAVALAPPPPLPAPYARSHSARRRPDIPLAVLSPPDDITDAQSIPIAEVATDDENDENDSGPGAVESVMPPPPEPPLGGPGSRKRVLSRKAAEAAEAAAGETTTHVVPPSSDPGGEAEDAPAPEKPPTKAVGKGAKGKAKAGGGGGGVKQRGLLRPDAHLLTGMGAYRRRDVLTSSGSPLGAIVLGDVATGATYAKYLSESERASLASLVLPDVDGRGAGPGDLDALFKSDDWATTLASFQAHLRAGMWDRDGAVASAPGGSAIAALPRDRRPVVLDHYAQLLTVTDLGGVRWHDRAPAVARRGRRRGGADGGASDAWKDAAYEGYYGERHGQIDTGADGGDDNATGGGAAAEQSEPPCCESAHVPPMSVDSPGLAPRGGASGATPSSAPGEEDAGGSLLAMGDEDDGNDPEAAPTFGRASVPSVDLGAASDGFRRWTPPSNAFGAYVYR